MSKSVILHLCGESIECDKCKLTSRKIVPSSIQRDKVLGRVIKYECSLNSCAENLKELNPKKFKYKLGSNLELGSQLKAKSIFILTKQLTKPSLTIINESGKHKSSNFIVNKYVFAEIKYPLDNVINSIRKRKSIKNPKT